MIRLGTIRWKNLLSTGNVFTEVDLGAPGTTLIVGPNGGGKSTLTDAMSFVLYGKPFRQISKNQLVNSINRKDMLVECEFQTGGRTYLIRRGMKPTVFEIHVDGEMMNMEGKVADQQEYLEKHILRINYKAFMQVVVLGSASYVPFMKLPAQHRRDVLEDLLDMRVLGVMMDLLKPMVQEVTTLMKDADHRRDLVLERISMRQKFNAAVLQDVAQRRKGHEDRIAELKEIKTELMKEGKTLSKTHERIARDMDKNSYEGEISTLKESMTLNANELTSIRSRLKFFGGMAKCPHCDQNMDEKHKKKAEKELKERETELADVMSQQIVQMSEYKEKASLYAATNKNLADIRSSISNLKTKVENIDRNIAYENSKMTEISETVPTLDLPDIPALEADLAAVDEERTALYNRRTTLAAIHTTLQDGGAKARIIGTYIPMINELINGFLKDLDFFVEFNLDSEFNESIKSRFRDEFTYSSFSEGEKMRIDLAILFTWRAVARAKNSASTNVVIMDEIFDSSLDPAGAEELMRLLNRITGDSSVFIISHRTDQMADKFERVIKFSKDGNFSVRVEV